MLIKIDLVAELRAALTAPDVRALLTASIKQAVKDAHVRDTQACLEHKAARQLIRPTVPSFAKPHRHPEIDQMCSGESPKPRLPSADPENWLLEQGHHQRHSPIPLLFWHP